MTTIFKICLTILLLATFGLEADGAQLVSVTDRKVELELNKGRLVRLSRAAATVFVADPEIADIQVKSPRLIYVMARKPGQTTLFAVDSAERVLANLELRVNHNLGGLRDAIARLHPDVNVSVSSVNDSIVLGGIVGSAATAEDLRRLAVGFAGDAEKVINRLGVDAPNQVNLRVRVAEVSRDIDKQLGINWSMLGSIGGMALGLTTANPFNVNVTQHTLTGSGSMGPFSMSAVLDALEEEGLVTVLAEPNLTAMSGETASFLAGGEFPIMVPQGDDRIVIEFKQFGVSLAFTPTLVGGNRISMHVRPEVSQLSSTGAVTVPISGGTLTVPALTTRRAETTVELGSGQSFAVAGLLKNNVTHDISKFPGLGDVPVLGRLFQSDRFQREESELVIIVTPYVVKPVSQRKLAVPTDGFHAPSDMERMIVGGTYKRNPDAGAPVTVTTGGQSLIGPVGFQLD
ncbi:type II and III secretion system protein family protein [Magnetospira sp. QH-2]|uniref:type II and III secretion system protein family protein n=1 Tax=Magnetospira sp. (strain QH-2) TaxID=1288970 RepID=UPI0003E815CE|nr:type II and III secretion system protein family protein [Magnetospira sp. QH-2]CCQ73550.1 Putative CpaC [Magnetospira sp. QH-2]